MEEDDLYESLPETTTVTTHMLAGAAAGVMEHSVMYPVDCVKTRMQSLVPDPKANYQSLADAFTKIIHEEGVRNTVRGINAVVLGAGPAHALYFAFYEKLKKTLSKGQQSNHFAHGVAGCGATLVHDAIMNPAEVVKQRMQVYGSPYRTCFHCTCSVLRKEGSRAFYRSYTTQLTMNIPFQSSHFMMYEIMQDFLNNDRAYNPVTHMVSGAVAGATAATITMPLDVCKTLLNTQEHCARTKLSHINGLLEACRTIFLFQGFSGFFRGLQARVIYQMPATAISWSVYEFFKFIISRRSEEEKYLNSPVKRMQVAAAASSR